MFDIFNTIFKYREKESPDKLGLYPESVHVNAMPERRYLWTSRILVVLSCLSISFNMMLASVIYVLLPQRTVYPRILRINDYFSQLEQIQPMERYVSAADLVAEQMIYKYIQLRHEIPRDYDEITKRWGHYETLYWMSSQEVYTKFENTEAKYNIQQFQMKGLRREVEIEWVKILAPGLWQAQFLFHDYVSGSTKPHTTIWRSIMRIGYRKIPFRNRSDLAKNPFGFLMINYSLGYLGTPETSAHYLETAKEASQKIF